MPRRLPYEDQRQIWLRLTDAARQHHNETGKLILFTMTEPVADCARCGLEIAVGQGAYIANDGFDRHAFAADCKVPA